MRSSLHGSSRAVALLVLGTGSVAFAALGAFFLFRPDLMVVERVEFVGNHRASEVALRHLVDIRNGTRIWEVDLGLAARGAEAHPWVRSATARRRLPYAVVVEIEEYEPVALLLADGLFYVDRNGEVFLRARSDELDFPVITGIDDTLARAHPDLPGLVVRDAIWLIRTMDERGCVPSERVSEVSFSRNRGFTLYLDSGATLAFGLERLEEQADRLGVLRNEGVDLEMPIAVDLAPATVAIVRPLEFTRSIRRAP